MVPTERRGSQPYIEVEDVQVLAMLGLLTAMRLTPTHNRQLRDWLRSANSPAEFELTPALVVRRVDELERARLRAKRCARLRDKWIVRNPEIKHGEPLIRGSRVSVDTLAERMAQGESTDVLDEDFPHIPAEAREVAVLYARANPRRGRPKRRSPPRWGSGSTRTSPHAGGGRQRAWTERPVPGPRSARPNRPCVTDNASD
ncbi:MAG: DUF433 domain-containing protein, partial [Solirubrobacteraceae bacterium]